ncbi:Redox-active disulfide protein 2 [Desulfonema limicola]|uniref:Redox-active disulfide protein 2 n=1 Tax=Desulfonema limicola TaxID=45656 RepID=A0A975B416_9BACT|nr:thioredoxin family protein [Desulfonema limicola]QTA78397.1 Redox-active disulfide protein 2 [Desulfonema limicola]
MSEVTQIMVGKYRIGVIGLKKTIADLGKTHINKSDSEVEAELINRISKNNYIAPNLRKDFGKALLTKFKRAHGIDSEENNLQTNADFPDIRVLGPGCSQCNKMESLVIEVLNEINLAASVEHITDIKEIAQYGVMGTPALVINSKVVWVGSVPSKAKLKALLESDASETKC